MKVRGFKIAAARKMIQTNKSGVDMSHQVMETLIDVRNDLKEIKNMIDGIVWNLQ